MGEYLCTLQTKRTGVNIEMKQKWTSYVLQTETTEQIAGGSFLSPEQMELSHDGFQIGV